LALFEEAFSQGNRAASELLANIAIANE
jgi:hypothetical protein